MATTYNVQSIFGINNLVAVITGGGSGIGKVMAHALAANDAKAVYILGRRKEALNATKESSSNPEVIHTIICDVTSKDSLAAAASQVRKEVGYCDVLFANSGVASASIGDAVKQIGTSTVKSVQEQLWGPTMEEFTHTFHVNVTGAFYTAIAFLDLLNEGNKRAVVPQKSQVIVTSSVAGFMRSSFTGFSYASSKAAATHLAKQLATAFAPLKIRSNVIAPGFYPSEMNEKSPLMQGNSREEGGLPAGLVPLERSGCEEELAGIALFLTSKAGGYLNGDVLVTDGGALSIVPGTY
ncbi:hypothetical protein HIM_08781 [Hirsutella minnesotensis 3608]|uniref:Uncharacterized protein n=1 Tax=Hirsutella minnesotensis 3608 TaxID=1043627 RepID=A0A0F7ZSS1_9HYPO|nr:hypothetical protein HIM_08781 [Hirsutella minnesotensis 3608]